MYLWVCRTKCAYFYYFFFSRFCAPQRATTLCLAGDASFSIVTHICSYFRFVQQIQHTNNNYFIVFCLLLVLYNRLLCHRLMCVVFGLVWLMSFFLFRLFIWSGVFIIFYIFLVSFSFFLFLHLLFLLSRSCIHFVSFQFVVFLIFMFCKIFNLLWYDSSVLGVVKHACNFLPD